MPDQLPLNFSGTKAKSRAARKSLAGHVPALVQRVLAYYRDAGLLGLTCDELEVLSNLPHQTASARIFDLRKLGKLEDGRTVRATRSGRMATVWRAKP